MTPDGRAEPGGRGGLAGAAGWVLVLVAASLPFSIALAQAAAGAAMALWAADSIRRRETSLRRNPFLVPVLAFSAIAAWSAFQGFRPEVSVPKLHRLLWFLLAFAIPDLAVRSEAGRVGFVRRIVLAVVAGGVVAAVLHFIKLGQALMNVPPDVGASFWLYHQGSMRSPQFHMTALLLLLASAGEGWLGLRPRVVAAALALNAAGLVLHFKRGIWGAFAGAAGLLGLTGLRVRGRTTAAVLVAVAALACVPQVRQRLIDAPRDFIRGGGRWELWTQATPKLMKLAPYGLGFGAMKNEDLRHLVTPLEAKICHLHNNSLQVLVEMGWAGLAAWTGWMAMLLVGTARSVRRFRGAPGHGRALARGLLAATAGLLLNGLVEVNFGAGAILMLFALLMGMAVALRDAADAGETQNTESRKP